MDALLEEEKAPVNFPRILRSSLTQPQWCIVQLFCQKLFLSQEEFDPAYLANE